ncbi:UNVERIFIED_CONTAM: hypothetical protein Scaly_0254800 [Sesamum calycinum]|uniref:Retrotransposon gag protein n=1 Tax=Sesamum calycinum TaxID=2727403 RepID=A0AAW2S9I6_9LAMI
MAIVPERTINDMTSPDLNQQPLCTEYPDLEVNFELKSGLVHLLSTFRGLAGEDPHKHLKEFHVFRTRYDDPPRKSNEVSIAAFDDRLNELTSPVKKIAVGRTQHVKACGICTLTGHATDMCPTLQESLTEHVEAIGEFFGQQQRRYDPFSNTYNPRWKNHPNLSYGGQSQNFQRPQYRPPVPPPSNPKQGTPLEDMMKSLIYNTQKIQQNTQQQIQQLQQNTEQQIQQFQQSVQQFQLSTQMSIQNLESQMSQLASSVSKLESQGKLPSQFVVNSKQNASAIVLRSGKQLQEHTDKNSNKRGHAQKRKPEKEVEIPQDQDDEAKEDNPKGASINVIPLTIFESLHVDPLKETGVVIPLADRSVVYPEGVLEDVLVQVNELVFPTDFYVLDMREDNFPNSTSILLGRPFLKTARTKIDVHAGTLTMEFDGEIIRFNIFDSMRYRSNIPTALFVDAFDPFVQKFPAIDDKDYIKFAFEKSPTPMEEGNMGVDPLVQVNAKFDGDSVFLAKINKDLTYGPRTSKNKAFHDKISSRKNSLMNIKVFIGQRHLRKHYIEEVDSECPTYSS